MTVSTKPTQQVAPGIHRLVLPLWGGELPEVNVYAIENGSDLMLVDAGYDSDLAREALTEQLASFGAKAADVKCLFITHMHFDHYGLSRDFNGPATRLIALGDPVSGTPFDRRTMAPEQIRAWFEANGVRDTEMPAWGRYRDAGYRPPDLLVEDGSHIQWGRYAFTVIWTPGHARGHACLLSSGGEFLFTGDHVLEHISPHIGLTFDDGGDPLGDYLASLERVAELPARLALPGHGEPFSPLQNRVASLAAHHRERSAEIQQALAREEQTAWDVAQQVTWLNDSQGWRQLDSFGRVMAVSETLAHLRHLERLASVTSRTERSRHLYAAAAQSPVHEEK
jgi:glyoxylase-like metal-dependent hydrolase (beta-lactamase superfamily II)